MLLQRSFQASRALSASGPRWGLYMLLLILPLTVFRPWPGAAPAAPGVLSLYVTPGLYLSDLVLLPLLLFLPFLTLRRQSWGYAGFTWPLVAITFLGLVTMPLALDPALAFYTTCRWALALGLYLLLCRGEAFLLGEAAMPTLVILLLVGLGVQAAVGVGQVIWQRPLGLPGELALAPDQPGAAIVTVGAARWLRAYGLTSHPNVLGGFLGVGLVLGLPLLADRRLRLLWWLLCLGWLLTFSRSAWLATALALCLAGAWLVRYRPALRRSLALSLAGAACITALLLPLLSGQVVNRLDPQSTDSERRSISQRIELQAIALGAIAARPLTGIGAGNFPLAVVAYPQAGPPQPVHNIPLLAAAEIGVLGGALWLCLPLAAGALLVRRWSRLGSCSVVLVTAWLALALIGLVDFYPWGLEAGHLLSICLLGLASFSLERQL